MLHSPTNKNKKIESLFFIVVMLLVFYIAAITPVDPDMWWHLRSGDEMWNRGTILLKDIFSYTRYGATWVNAFWLSDLGLYGLWKLGGFFTITIAVALVAVVVMSIVYHQMRGNFYLRMPLILLAMISIAANWSARPQILSFLLLALLDYYLFIHRYVKRQHLWYLVPIFLIWANIHGGFIWGILLLLATIVGEIFDNLFENQPSLQWNEIAKLTLWSILAGLAVVINPNGISIWRLPFYQIQVSLSIVEWLSPDFHQLYAHPLLWILFLLIISVAYSKKPLSLVDLLKGLGFTYMFFVSQRNMAPYAIIVIPIIERHLTPAVKFFAKAPFIKNISAKASQLFKIKQPSEKLNFAVNTLLVSVLTALVLMKAYAISTPQVIRDRTPYMALQWIKDNRPRGSLFNSYYWGGYLTWELRDYPVFIDGRADLYGNKILSEWSEIANGTEKGMELLNTYKINLVFLEPNYPLLDKLSQHGWEKVYEDSKITIYERQPPIP